MLNTFKPSAWFHFKLRVDRPRPGSMVQRRGTLIGWEAARQVIVCLRAAQVGEQQAEAMRTWHGTWDGEPGMKCLFTFAPVPGKEGTESEFHEHMLDLGQRIALRLGQEEVQMERGKTAIISPVPQSLKGRRVR